MHVFSVRRVFGLVFGFLKIGIQDLRFKLTRLRAQGLGVRLGGFSDVWLSGVALGFQLEM